MRSVQYRLEKLEAARLPAGSVDCVIGLVPLSDESVDQGVIQQWIDDGLVQVGGGYILYTGGESYPVTIEEWEAQYCNEKGCHPKVTPVH